MSYRSGVDRVCNYITRWLIEPEPRLVLAAVYALRRVKMSLNLLRCASTGASDRVCDQHSTLTWFIAVHLSRDQTINLEAHLVSRHRRRKPPWPKRKARGLDAQNFNRLVDLIAHKVSGKLDVSSPNYEFVRPKTSRADEIWSSSANRRGEKRTWQNGCPANVTRV